VCEKEREREREKDRLGDRSGRRTFFFFFRTSATLVSSALQLPDEQL